MKKVLTSLEEAAKLVKDGALVTFGGATFSRAPMEFVRELVRQGKGTSDESGPNACHPF